MYINTSICRNLGRLILLVTAFGGATCLQARDTKGEKAAANTPAANNTAAPPSATASPTTPPSTPPAKARPGSGCSICASKPCGDGYLGYFCLGTNNDEVCKPSGIVDGCSLQCDNEIMLDCLSSTAKGCSQPDFSAAKASESRRPTDDEIQEVLLRQGAAAVKSRQKYDGPVLLVKQTRTNTDLLQYARLLNTGKKAITSVRFGYTIMKANSPTERRLGDWNNLNEPIRSDEYGDLDAQHLDTLPLRTAGTVITIYLADVGFQDGSSWHNDDAITDSELKSVQP